MAGRKGEHRKTWGGEREGKWGREREKDRTCAMMFYIFYLLSLEMGIEIGRPLYPLD
jgi:hypothetical protein